ncbi:hypothetical protein [Pseudaestuariivita rosea]|uniref:hypothetical protein n=1 Tax=Pseudaestuariivita rosea TaxID=2763263 RepID=UPI001ABB2906|nr:hypothetical protein [Pseudaestuariivita rosea]
MEQISATSAARAFLDKVWGGDAPSDAELSSALDQLVCAYHATKPQTNVNSDVTGPERDWNTLYAQTGARFPDYGYYSVADPMDMISFSASVGDAIDDIADITQDMREVIWLAENSSAADAEYRFRTLFFHWGRHARELTLYLHARQFG